MNDDSMEFVHEVRSRRSHLEHLVTFLWDLRHGRSRAATGELRKPLWALQGFLEDLGYPHSRKPPYYRASAVPLKGYSSWLD